METPECPQHLEGKCPKSDVVLMAEHGPPQQAHYWSFRCRTCKYLFLEWNKAIVEAAKRKSLDREMGNLVNPRFRGLS